MGKLVKEVPVDPRPSAPFVDLLGADAVEEFKSVAANLASRLEGRTIWNVNSTSAGGGVAEMLHTLLAYAQGMGVDARWLVIGGNADFFRVTKRLHNALHGEPGDGTRLDETARRGYEQVAAANTAELDSFIGPRDLVILHDPQTAGLIPHLVRRGVGVIWRCHIGNDAQNSQDSVAWGFLEPYLKQAHGFIFSRFSYLPEALYHGRCLVVAPSIDPFSPKNQDMDDATVRAILTHLGVVTGPSTDGPRAFSLADGSVATVERRADVIMENGPPTLDTPLVVQVSRWDRLKDPIGVLEGFIRSLRNDAADHADLVLAGPDVRAVADDPEGAEVFDEVLARWRSLPPPERSRVHLVNLPMDNLQENAAMVNALQRHATMVVQKSLREGFGLTVTEAMWKARPVIASAVGGIRDQIEHGVSGLLLSDPTDLDAFAGSVTQVLGNRGLAERLGRNGRRRVTRNYLGLRILATYDDLVERLDYELSEARTAASRAG